MQEIGGLISVERIRSELKERYPKYTYWVYATTTLRKLKNKDQVYYNAQLNAYGLKNHAFTNGN